jgi:hypothetical protein
MNTRHHLLGMLVLCGLAWWLITDNGRSATPQREGWTGRLRRTVSQETARQEAAAYAQAVQAHIQELGRLEYEQNKRARALAQTEASRKSLQLYKQTHWSHVISTNWDAYLALRQKAQATPTGETPCTLCQGNWYMRYCILCDSTGKCPTCGGTGKTGNDDYCPTCVGTGKCFRCAGSGKMGCPFCNDGMIEARGPSPPTRMPTN